MSVYIININKNTHGIFFINIILYYYVSFIYVYN